MVIKESDRLADVLARDERVLEIMLATVPDLRGLRNPVTRRVMGKLATVAQVARMAGMEPDILIRRINTAMASTAVGKDEAASGQSAELAAAPAPRLPENDPDQEQAVTDPTSTVPMHLSGIAPDLLSHLDVRDDLRNGREPFSRIMSARAALPAGGVLRLRATFEPVPLYAVMGKQGFEHWTEQLAEDDWQVWFYPNSLAAAELPAGAVEGSGALSGAAGDAGIASSAGAPSRQEESVEHASDESEIVVLDVRGLEPPEPMIRTLAALETLPAGRTLLQINERIPQFLLPRLEELGFVYEVREQAEAVVRVFIRRP